MGSLEGYREACSAPLSFSSPLTSVQFPKDVNGRIDHCLTTFNGNGEEGDFWRFGKM